jgi:hypothetical protein
MIFANFVKVNNEIKQGDVNITEEKANEFKEFWRFHAKNPLYGNEIIEETSHSLTLSHSSHSLINRS